ncbi:MAG: hypothetical protein M3Q07_09015 [Pseudobdellovibrionaceae bacterium]|nr:hypothetical protein [Pseudobdellovibrionaceae bacterium]
MKITVTFFLLVSGVVYAAPPGPDPIIEGNTSRYIFETANHFEFSDAKGAYYTSDRYPTINLGVACRDNNNLVCRQQVFDDGRCVLVTAPIVTAGPARIEIGMNASINAIRKGFSEYDVANQAAFETFVTAVDGNGSKVNVSETFTLNRLIYIDDLEKYPDQSKLMRFTSGGFSSIYLKNIKSLRLDTEVDDLRISICGVHATFLSVKNIDVTVILDNN